MALESGYCTSGLDQVFNFCMIECVQVVNELADIHCPVVEIPTRAKLSCLSWNKCIKPLIASSDYEGIVTVWDVNTKRVNFVPPVFQVLEEDSHVLSNCTSHLLF